jgi:myosin heavy subunit
MSDDVQQESTPSQNLTEDEIAALVSGIERPQIVELVKHSSHLQQHIFRGFRPSRLPWDQVPARLAHYAYGDSGRLKTLIALWVASNGDLLDEVKAISPDQVREGVAELLARRGIQSKLQVLWALRLDDREEVRQALEAGLADEITAETSELLSRAQSNVLIVALENAQAQVAELRERLAEAESARDDSRRLLQRKNEQLEAAQAEIAGLQEERSGLVARVDEQVQVQGRLEAELLAIQQQLAEEQAANAELRKSVHDLKDTLRAQVESSRQEETQQRLNDALLALEAERKESASLRLKVNKLEQRLESAYARQDEEHQRSETLTQQLQRLERAKEVVIEEKRKLTRELEVLQGELDSIRRQSQDQAVHGVLETLPLSELDARWLEERQATRDYLHALMRSSSVHGEMPSLGADRWKLWSQWLEREASLVHDALGASGTDAHLDNVRNLEHAQQLLALRWYLLEYTRQAMLLADQEHSFPV